MKNDKLKRFIKTTIREFLNENEYVDDILDRKNKYGKISDDDKEYLDKYSKGEDVSDLEKNYDEFEKIRKSIFDRKPNPSWEFFISKGFQETIPIFYDKQTNEIMERGSVRYEGVDGFKIYIINPEEAEKANKSMQDELQDFLWKLIMETDTYINNKYVGYNQTQVMKNLNKMNVSFNKKVNSDNSIDIRIWDYESNIKMKIVFQKRG
jgi:hypothetical protein